MIMLRLQSQYSCILCFNKKNWFYPCKNSSMPLYILFFLTKMLGNFWFSLHISFICEIAPDHSRLEAGGTFLTFSLNVYLISISDISVCGFLLKDKSIFLEGRNELGPGTQTHWPTQKKSWFREYLVFKTENLSCWVIPVHSHDFGEMASYGYYPYAKEQKSSETKLSSFLRLE